MPRVRSTTRGDGGCFADGCTARAEFGMACDGAWRPFLCGAHASPWADKMVRMLYPRCSTHGCTKLAKYGADPATPAPAVLCGTHFKNRHGRDKQWRTSQSCCAACTTRACAGMPGAPAACAVLCGVHGDALKFVNVVSTTCACGVVAWWGPADGKRKRCGTCKNNGDVYKAAVPRCACGKQASVAAKGASSKMSAVMCCGCALAAAASGAGLDDADTAAAADAAAVVTGAAAASGGGSSGAAASASGGAGAHSVGDMFQSVTNYRCVKCVELRVPKPTHVPKQGGVCAKCHAGMPLAARGPSREFCSAGEEHLPRVGVAPADMIAARKAAGMPLRHATNARAYACHADGCDLVATFGIPGSKQRTHCSVHAKAQTVVDGKPRMNLDWAWLCTAAGCLRPAYYRENAQGATPTRCSAHVEDGMVNAQKHHKCATCGDNTYVGTKGDACADCRRYTTRVKAQELSVQTALEHAGLHAASRDALLPCAVAAAKKLRPDFVWRVPCAPEPAAAAAAAAATAYYNVVLEVDEAAHAGYEARCEIGRLHALAESFGGEPLVVVRYNPDATISRAKARGAAARASTAAADTGEADPATVAEHVRAHAALVAVLQTQLRLPPAAMPPFGLVVHYVGYAAGRVDKLHAVQERLYDDAGRVTEWSGSAKDVDAADGDADAEDEDADSDSDIIEVRAKRPRVASSRE